MIFKDAENKQCLKVGKTLAQSQNKLNKIGVETTAAYCADRTDRYYMQVCGSGTPHIHVFEISESDLEQAKQAGFSALGTIPIHQADCHL